MTDLIGGAALIVIGLWFAAQSLSLEIGTARRMGPGYFPLALSLLLMFLGVLVGLKDFARLRWRGTVCILAAPILFGLTVRGLGFVPGLFLATALAAQASRRLPPLHGLLLAALVTVFATGVFIYGLNLPIRPFGPWLSF